MSSRKTEYSDDFFAKTRMSFGDHLEELRWRMWAALKGLLVCLVLGFALDSIGTMLDRPNFGIGKPVLELIKRPVEDQMNRFYDNRAWQAIDQLMGPVKSDNPEEKRKQEEERRELKQRFMEDAMRMRDSSTEELNAPQPITVLINRAELKAAAEGDGEDKFAKVTLKIRAIDMAIIERLAQERIGKRNQLTTLSAQEMFVVYFKVTLLCGVVLSSPWIFFQFWAFVGAGLYPHERRYIHVYLPFSIGLFLIGVFLCFFWVLPGTVKALLAFNEWLGVDPDLRLNEWLSLALILPLVFGVSFQTPLVMLFLNRLGMFGWEDYLSKWRYAIIILACFSAIITPTPDAVTMMYLFVPMFGLYMLGILLCKWMPPPDHAKDSDEGASNDEVAV